MWVTLPLGNGVLRFAIKATWGIAFFELSWVIDRFFEIVYVPFMLPWVELINLVLPTLTFFVDSLRRLCNLVIQLNSIYLNLLANPW